MNRKQAILRLIKPRNVIKVRGLDELSIGVIAPAVIATSQNRGGSALFLGDSVCSVPADIMEGPDVSVASQDQEYREPCDVERLVVAYFDKPTAMGQIEPVLKCE